VADTKISGLSAGAPAQAGDLIPIARSGANYSITPANILAYGTSPVAGTSGTFSTTLGVTGATTLGAAIVGPATATVFNTVSTTVNAFGAASTALNMGHASGTNTILGATTFSQALTASSTISSRGLINVRASGTDQDHESQWDNSDTEVSFYGSRSSGVSKSFKFYASNTGGSLGLTVNASGMNGILGATTPAAATVTTLSATKTITAATGSDAARSLYIEGYPTGLETALFYRDNTDDQPVIKVRHDRATGATAATVLRFSEQANATVGSITITGTATAYNTSSDRRLKNIDGDLTGSGAFIDALQPRVGTWKADGSPFVGFIADEVQLVSPRSVVGEPDAVDDDGHPIHQAMEYGSADFIANIIAELKSVRGRLAKLEAA
jgi:hypothetical protein